jgi:hypothetical protein
VHVVRRDDPPVDTACVAHVDDDTLRIDNTCTGNDAVAMARYKNAINATGYMRLIE